jgi:LPS-assembly lipoprotein
MKRILTRLTATVLLAGLALSAGCGFHLRGQSTLPFTSAYVEAAANSVMAGRLRTLLGQEGKLTEQRDKADTVIRLTGESRVKTILSLSGAGKVREYRLTHKISVSAVDSQGRELLAPSEIQLSRDFSFSDAQLLAKEAEEAALQRDMDEDTLRQITRRLAFVNRP